MSGRHVALIIEDEPDMAAEIGDLLRSFGHDHIHAETLAEGLACLERGGFCYVLLDLQIKADRHSIMPRVESGMTLLREIRRRFPRRNDNDMHLLPVIAVSGHGREPRNIIGAYNSGLNEFILKPLSLNEQDIGSKIRTCLERAGRNGHGTCHAQNHASSNGPNKGPTSGDPFWHAPDYSEARLHGESFSFTGDINRSVIRLLHAAAGTSEPWCIGKTVLKEAGSTDLNMRMVNLFGRHPAWNVLILSDGRRKYRLRTE